MLWAIACLSAWGHFRTVAALLHPQLYARATNEFRMAAFIKPAGTNEAELSFKLAPLILQELNPGTGALDARQGFGAVTLANGAVLVNPRRPAVYFEASTPMINSKPHARLAYFWIYPAGPAASNLSSHVQGVRLTLDSSGEPAVWEMLADSSGLDIVFVSQKLELAAAAEYGAVLPGRRYAIERGTNEAPRTLVARVIDDTPAPMGPMVYLEATSRCASTVTCRCMPVQARALLRTQTYELLPVDGVMHLWPSKPVEESGAARCAFWPGEIDGAPTLPRSLRLPRSF